MEKIKIITDSSCDLTPELRQKYNIELFPFLVNVDGEDYFDNGSVSPQMIFDLYNTKKKLPKTAARSEFDYSELFKSWVDKGYKVVFVSISSELSVTCSQGQLATEKFPNDVFFINTKSLSTGVGLTAIAASELMSAGKTAKEIYDILSKRVEKLQVSFVVDTLEYLCKNGRCSALSVFGANLLKLRPRLNLIDGKIINTEKYRGKMNIVLKKYIDDTLAGFNYPDRTRCFITHSSAEREIVDEIVEYVKSKNIFKEVIETVAGPTITAHCGKGTLGILYFNDGEKI